jgi:cell filamentation protein
MNSKKSIRFFNDHKVRAVWSDADNKWYFSATDVVRAINDEQDYVKAGNYWRWLKKKLAAEGVQLVSDTHDFKFEAPDGKMRKADVLDNEAVLKAALTDQIDDREIFMKGIDYSYYYEQAD